MKGLLHRPFVGHAVIALFLLASLAVVRAAYVGPREQERKALGEAEARLQAELADLAAGFEELAVWAREHPGQDFVTYRARRALAARDMVAAFLHDLVPIAERHGVATESIQPLGAWTDAVVPDASGAPITYRKAEIVLRVYARYEALGEYIRAIEAMDQLVVVRSVALQHNASTDPRHVADVTIWIYGTP